MTRSRLRSSLLTLVRYGVGLAVLWWVVRQANWSEINQLLTRVTLSTLGLLVAVSVVGTVSRVFTWKVLIGVVGDVSFIDAARVDLATNFVNQLLPSRVSGRSISPLIIARVTNLSFGGGVGVSGMHTGLWALIYSVVAVGGIFAIVGRVTTPITLLVAGSTILYLVVGVGIIAAGTRMELFESVLNRFLILIAQMPLVGHRIERLAETIPRFASVSGQTFRAVSRDLPRLFAFSIAWTVALPLTAALRVWVLFETLGIAGVSPILLPFILLTAYSVTLLPLTPGGIGVTETTATIVFVGLGIPANVAASVVLADRFLGVYFPALVGWYPTVKLELRDKS